MDANTFTTAWVAILLFSAMYYMARDPIPEFPAWLRASSWLTVIAVTVSKLGAPDAGERWAAAFLLLFTLALAYRTGRHRRGEHGHQ